MFGHIKKPIIIIRFFTPGPVIAATETAITKNGKHMITSIILITILSTIPPK